MSRRRKLVEGSTLGAGVLLATALLLLVNYLGWKHHERFDWTSQKIYSLSEQSVNVARGLDRDIEVVVFSSPVSPLLEAVSELLARYAAESERIRVREIDPVTQPVEAARLLEHYETRYDPERLKVVFDAGEGRRRLLEESDLATFDYSNYQLGGEASLESLDAEGEFTHALIELSRGESTRVLFTAGHGERSLEDRSGRGMVALGEMLGRGDGVVEAWVSLGETSVPEGTDLVVIAGPTVALSAPEVEVLASFVKGGGRALLLLDPALDAAGGLVDLGLSSWLSGLGVELGMDVVFDPGQNPQSYGPETFYAFSQSDHPVTRAIAQARIPLLVSRARSVSEGSADVAHTLNELFETSALGWGERGLDRLDELARDELDLAGPVPLAVSVEAATEIGTEVGTEFGTEAGEQSSAGRFRLVVIGDSDLACDYQIATAGNGALLGNAVAWLLQRESELGIPPKRPEQTRLLVGRDELLRIYLVIALLPLAAILAGIAVYTRRRR